MAKRTSLGAVGLKALGFGLVLGIATPAAALSQSKHRSLSVDACWKMKLPSEFCDEVGAAAYNVDHYEWDVLAAHAQPEVGESKCEAADAAIARIRALAIDARANGMPKFGESTDLAHAFGRLLHTLQDNCAHSGVPNTQHAWLSLSDSCLDTESSPDLQPEAIECAKHETLLAFDALAAAIDAKILKVTSRFDPEQRQPAMYFPPRAGVCDFLKSSASWDGVDRRWNNDVVVPLLRDQLYLSLIVDPDAPPGEACASGSDAIEPVSSAPPVDTSKPIEWCTSLNIYCVGKTDGADTAPPWESAEPPTAQSPSSSGDDSGCNLSGSGSAHVGLSALLLAAFFARCRRR
jgi:hypothetical protein